MDWTQEPQVMPSTPRVTLNAIPPLEDERKQDTDTQVGMGTETRYLIGLGAKL